VNHHNHSAIRTEEEAFDNKPMPRDAAEIIETGIENNSTNKSLRKQIKRFTGKSVSVEKIKNYKHYLKNEKSVMPEDVDSITNIEQNFKDSFVRALMKVPEKVVVLATEYQKHMLTTAPIWYIDGTFKVNARKSGEANWQLLSIVVTHEKLNSAACWIWVESTQTVQYQAAFDQLRFAMNLKREHEVKIFLDFEDGKKRTKD
jgi:hypothetical protein